MEFNEPTIRKKPSKTKTVLIASGVGLFFIILVLIIILLESFPPDTPEIITSKNLLIGNSKISFYFNF